MGLSRLSSDRDDRALARTRRVARGWLLTLLLCSVGGVAAQPLMLDDVEVRTLEAQANGVDYRLWVRVPKGDWPAGKRFHVVYLLDADYSFLLARNITDHLTERGHLEPLLLVGIGYAGPTDERSYRLDRTRDYTPWHSPDGGYGPEYQKFSGGGPRFADFLEKELFPWVEREYPATSDRTLVGHSYGGLFASWMLVERPHAFKRYIVVSPSLWYAGRKLFATERQRAAALATKGGLALDAQAHFGVGASEVSSRNDMPELMTSFVGQLEAAGYAGFELSSRVWEDETHNSIFPLVLSTGLRRVHGGR